MPNQTTPTNRFWWPDQLDLSLLRQNAAESNPMGDDFNYAEEFSTLDLAAVKKDIEGGDDDLSGLVAGGLRALRAAVHPDGVARCGHLSRRGRPRRRPGRPAAVRAAQQLAG